MEFTEKFTVHAPLEQAWALLTNVERIAPCLPGASDVVEVGENTYTGAVGMKVGPIKVAYRGTVSFRELDAAKKQMILDARGSENSGKGSAAAVVTIQLVDTGAGTTDVNVHSNLQITGKVAQFGRSAMADVAGRVIDQFANNLQRLMEDSGESAVAPGAAAASGQNQAAPGSNAGGAPANNDLDALALVLPLAKQALPAVAAFMLGLLSMWVLGRRK